MTKITDIPAIRFKGFSDTWEQRKLGEIGSVSMCRRIFKEQTSENGEIPFYKIGTFGGEADAFISRELFEEYKAKYQYPKKGDILISASGSIGRTVVFTGKNEYFQDSNIVWLNHDKHLDNSFLKCFYSIVKWAGIEGSTIKRLYNDNILNTAITLPSVEEQQKIGAYFENLDNLITLHQRKYDKLTNVKKSMLGKMFPQNGSNVPEIRFKGFTEAWEQRKFDDITYPAGEKNRDNLPYESYSVTNENGFIPQNEQFENGGTMATADKSMYYIVSKNSFAYNPARINVGSIGYYDKPENVIVSSLYEVFKTSEDIDDRFLWHWFKSDAFQRMIEQYQEGGVRLYFYYDKLCMCSLPVPDIQEQRKIGKQLDILDNLITLHQRKCQIDGCRFQSPLAITWEQRKLSEIATMHARIGWQNLRTSEFLDNGDYMLITGTDFMDGAVNFDTCHYVERERYEQDKHIQIRNGSILITKDGTLGKVAYIQGLTMPATLNAGVFNVEIRDEKEVDNRYLFQYLKAPFLMDYVDKKATGGTIKHLNQNILVDFPVVLPQKDEQAKIGEYFLGIDNLITLHQCE